MLLRQSLLRPLTRSSRTYATVSPPSLSTASAAGVKIASLDLGQPTTTLSVVIKAGARYESKAGVANALKNFAFKATSTSSALKTVRETELYGGVLSAGLGREELFLNAEFLRGDEDYFLSLLASVLSSTKFHPHEFQELVLPIIQSDTLNAISTPSVLALDLAHTIAFRRGLGNSLFASPHSPITAQDVKQFAGTAFAKGNIAVFGTGIGQEELKAAVTKAFGSGGSASGSTVSGSASQYYGGEQRVPLDGHSGGNPTMIIAYGTTSTLSPELAIIPHLLGGESALKWVPGTSPLSLASAKYPGSKAKSFLLPYSDASLVGVELSAPTSEALRDLAKDVAGALKGLSGKGGLKEEEIKKAVAGAKFGAASAVESKEGLLASYGPQILGSGSLKSLEDITSSFSNVSAESISKAAGELFKAKPTVVAVGNLEVLPYADELGL